MIDVTTASEWELRRFVQSVESFVEETGCGLPLSALYRYNKATGRLEDIAAERAEQQRLAREKAEQERLAADAAKAAAREKWLADPLNEATARGWQAMKRQAPNLDGVDHFTDLPDALLYRYGEFARAVLEKPLREVLALSHNQVRDRLPARYDGPLEYVWAEGDDEEMK